MSMGVPIPFFEQSGVSGNQSVTSPVFDVASFGELVAEFKCVALGGTASVTLDGRLEHSADRDRWDTLLSFSQFVIGSTPPVQIEGAPAFARFVRAVVTTGSTSNDAAATFALLGIARPG